MSDTDCMDVLAIATEEAIEEAHALERQLKSMDRVLFESLGIFLPNRSTFANGGEE